MPARRDARGRFAKAGAGASSAPKPSRPGPSEAFLAELWASWARHGAETIERVRDERPHDYLRLMASSLVQPQPEAGPDMIAAMSDDEVADELRRILDQLAAAGADPGA